MADRAIDISESNNFIYPNVVDDSTKNILALSDRRLLNLKSWHAGRAGKFGVVSGKK